MDKFDIFYNGIDPLTRLFFVGTLAYISIIFLMRIFGSRSLSTMNAFDFIITVTLGSVFGRVLTAKGVALSEAVFAFLLLLALQLIFLHWKPVQKFLKISLPRNQCFFFMTENLKEKLCKNPD